MLLQQNLNDLKVLLPYQQRWVSDQSPVKVWEKSRRIGATWCEASDAVMIASRSQLPSDYYYTSINEDLARDFIRDCASWAQAFNCAVTDVGETVWQIKDDGGEKEDIKVRYITFASGKRIMALPSKAAVLRGRQGYLLLDEFAFVENPAQLIKAAMAFLMWGGKVRILSTHNGVDSEFNNLIKDIRAGKSRYKLHRTTLDDALEEGLYQRICLKTGQKWSLEVQEQWRDDLVDFYGEGADEELFCIPSNSGGRYLSRVLVERAMEKNLPILSLDLKNEFSTYPEAEKVDYISHWLDTRVKPLKRLFHPHYRTSFGYDVGRSGDLSYLIVFQELPNLIRETMLAIELRNVPFSCQQQIIFYVCDRLPRLIGGAIDARGIGAPIAEAMTNRYGQYRIEEVMITNNWYNESFPPYKAALEDNNVILPKCANLLSDHLLAETIKNIPKIPETKNKGTDGKSRHGDGLMAAVLAWRASRNESEGCFPAAQPMELNFSDLRAA